MAAAGDSLKQSYPFLSHVTCVAHLLENCAEKLVAYFDDVDRLICSVKAITGKNASHRNLCSNVGLPPQPVVTRSSTWLSAATFYADNFPAIKEIIKQFTAEGICNSSSS